MITGILELLAEIGVAPGEIDVFIHGTTLANNAIIERNGAVTVANTGFRRSTADHQPLGVSVPILH